MQAIQTKYHGPTNTRGSRISAKAEGVRGISIPYPHELNTTDAHAKAANELANKYNWLEDGGWTLVGGGLPDQSGMAFVFVKR